MSVLFPQREGGMFGKAWELGKESVTWFINDGALSRGAAIAFYTVTSIGPVLLIVVAIAGLAFGQDAARGAIVSQLSGLMGQESAELLQNVIRSASEASRIFASALGHHASSDRLGMFGEMQSA
jgi:membrane protein